MVYVQVVSGRSPVSYGDNDNDQAKKCILILVRFLKIYFVKGTSNIKPKLLWVYNWRGRFPRATRLFSHDNMDISGLEMLKQKGILSIDPIQFIAGKIFQGANLYVRCCRYTLHPTSDRWKKYYIYIKYTKLLRSMGIK